MGNALCIIDIITRTVTCINIRLTVYHTLSLIFSLSLSLPLLLFLSPTPLSLSHSLSFAPPIPTSLSRK